VSTAGHPIAKKLIPVAVITVLVMFGITLYADADSLFAALAAFDLRALALAVALASLNLTVRFVRWHYYLNHLGIKAPKRMSAGIFLSGLSMSITPGKLGELLKCFMLRDRIGTRIAKTAPIVVAERYTDIVGVFALVAIGATQFSGAGPILIVGGIFMLAVFVVLSASDKMVDRAGALLSRALFKGRSFETDWARESGATFRTLLRGRPLAVGTLLGGLAWFFECLAAFVVLRGFGETGVTVIGATFTYATATLAGALSMLPGGLGATEGGMTVLFEQQGVPRDIAAGSTIVTRAATLWWGVGVGAVMYFAHAAFSRQALAEAVSEEEGA